MKELAREEKAIQQYSSVFKQLNQFSDHHAVCFVKNEQPEAPGYSDSDPLINNHIAAPFREAIEMADWNSTLSLSH